MPQLKIFARYLFIGSLALGVDYASYFLFSRVFGITPYVANIIAYACGNVVSFIGHRFFTFGVRGLEKIHHEYARFLAVTVVGMLISEVMIIATISASIPDVIGKAVAVVVSGLFNFTANSLWTFPRERRGIRRVG